MSKTVTVGAASEKYKAIVLDGLSNLTPDEWIEIYTDGGGEFSIFKDEDIYFHYQKRVSKGWKEAAPSLLNVPDGVVTISTCELKMADGMIEFDDFKKKLTNYVSAKLAEDAIGNAEIDHKFPE